MQKWLYAVICILHIHRIYNSIYNFMYWKGAPGGIYTDERKNMGISYTDSNPCRSSCVLERYDSDISDVGAAWNQMAGAWSHAV